MSCAFGYVEPVKVRIASVESARITGTATLVDNLENTETVKVDVAFKGVGDRQRAAGQFLYTYPGGRTVYRSNGFIRSATASGSILNSQGTNLIAGASMDDGSLDYSTSGSLQVARE